MRGWQQREVQCTIVAAEAMSQMHSRILICMRARMRRMVDVGPRYGGCSRAGALLPSLVFSRITPDDVDDLVILLVVVV